MVCLSVGFFVGYSLNRPINRAKGYFFGEGYFLVESKELNSWIQRTVECQRKIIVDSWRT